MSREIKFRAWTGKEMLTPPLHSYYGLGRFFGFLPNYENINLMQFTGLKDKNGKEIYEGDVLKDTLTGAILKVCFGFSRYGGYTGWYCEFLNVDRNGFVSINNNSDSDKNSQIEIIGNIYENPELLTSTPND